MISKKDYQAIAQAFVLVRKRHPKLHKSTYQLILAEVVYALWKNNHLFNAQRFYEYIEEEGK